MYSSRPHINASILSSMQVSPLLLTFPHTYSLSLSFISCNDVCIVISFLVFWFNCWRSCLVYFMKGHDYLIREIAQVFIPLVRFTLWNLVSSFLVRLRYSFLFFISSLLVWFKYSQVLVSFLFFERFEPVLIWQFYSFRLPSFVFLPFSILAWHIFLFKIQFLCRDGMFLFF